MEDELSVPIAAPSICICEGDVHNHTTSSFSQACGLCSQGKNTASGDPSLSPMHYMCGERRGAAVSLTARVHTLMLP